MGQLWRGQRTSERPGGRVSAPGGHHHPLCSVTWTWWTGGDGQPPRWEYYICPRWVRFSISPASQLTSIYNRGTLMLILQGFSSSSSEPIENLPSVTYQSNQTVSKKIHQRWWWRCKLFRRRKSIIISDQASEDLHHSAAVWMRSFTRRMKTMRKMRRMSTLMMKMMQWRKVNMMGGFHSHSGMNYPSSLYKGSVIEQKCWTDDPILHEMLW